MKFIKKYESQIKDKDIIITLPKNIKWEDYEKELKKVENGDYEINFKVNNFPKYSKKGNKCYLVHNGFIIGYQYITGFINKSLKCSTTNKKWIGNFIKRSGKFYYLDEKIPMKGFQGYRYY